MNDSGRIYHVPVKVLEKKKLKTILGEVATIRVEPEMFGEGRPLRGDGRLSIWFTDDERRVPVLANLKMGRGGLNIKLKSARNTAASVTH